MKRILDKRNMTAEDWQAYRETQKGIGGSDVATILNLNPYKSPFALWLEKTGQVKPDQIDNEYIEWGNILEPVIRDKFKKETGFKVYQNNFVIQHDTHEFMIANIDGEVKDPSEDGRGILEIKTASERMKPLWVDGPPNHYMLQMQHYMATLDYHYGYFAVLIGGNHFKYFKVERNEYIIDKIIAAEMEFMRMVENNIAPDVTGHAIDTQWINQIYPQAEEVERELPNELFDFTIRYVELQEQAKEIKYEMDTIKNKLKYEAKNTKILSNEYVRVTMPTIKKVSFDQNKFAQDFPDLYEEYKNKETVYRSFSVKILEGD